jgi:hypothetical protein
MKIPVKVWDLILRFGAWRKVRRQAKMKALFTALCEDKESGMTEIFQSAVDVKATNWAKNWMDARGYVRCFYCLESGRLRRYGTRAFICEHHHADLEKRKAAFADGNTPLKLIKP